MKKENSKVVGVVRNLDALGRIVLPKEFRRYLNMEAEEPVEMVLYEDGIFVRKYAGLNGAKEQLELLERMILNEDSGLRGAASKIQEHLEAVKMLLEQEA